MAKTPKEVLALIKDKDVKFVDIKFIDVPGTWQHFTMPAHRFEEDVFTDGLPFDGSSVRGFQTIDESDMLLVPDPETAMLDPFTEITTLSIIGGVEDPITRQKYPRDPRNIAKAAEAYLYSTGLADAVYFGPEAEFYVFNDVRYATTANES